MLAVLAIALSLAGCWRPRIDENVAAPRYRSTAIPPRGNNWPIAPARAGRIFRSAPLQILSAEPTATGVAGAFKADVAFTPEQHSVAVKWKVVPPGDMDGWNNNARKELAVYVIQRWFLEPRDYVVPTTAIRCVPLDQYRRIDPAAEATLEGTTCVLGTISLWLQHVQPTETILDGQRFTNEYAYAYHLSNFNVLTYLVRHRDGRPGNILVADDDTNRRVFAVDNGISFDALVYNFLVPNWDELRVPAIRRAVVEELRDVDREDLEALGTLLELRADPKGMLRPVRPTAPIDPTQGVRVTPGRIQFGLTAAEIDGVATRLRQLLQRVDDGTLAVF